MRRSVVILTLAFGGLLSVCFSYVPLADSRLSEQVVRLHSGSKLQLSFSVPAKGVYDIRLEYPASTLGTESFLLLYNGITGQAAVSSNGTVLKQAKLPTHSFTRHEDWCATKLIHRLTSEAAASYSLSLEITELPRQLQDIPGKVTVVKLGRKHGGTVLHPPNQAMERTATRGVFTFATTELPSLRAALAIGSGRSSCSR